jgi:hypothetical protein
VNKVPVFIEMPNPGAKPEALVCQIAINVLSGLGYANLPLASSIDDLNAQLALLKDKGGEPALFVVNTFNAREVIKQLDPIVGDSPMIFLRRNMYAGKSGLSEHFDVGADKESTMTAMKNMKPRLTAVWNYGSLNGPEVARVVARAIDAFVKNGDFRAVERQSQIGIKTRM